MSDHNVTLISLLVFCVALCVLMAIIIAFYSS